MLIVVIGFIEAVLYYAYPLEKKKRAWWLITAILSLTLALPLFLYGRSGGGMAFLMLSFASIVIAILHWWKSTEFD